MSRETSTILTNLCLIEDTLTNKVVLQYRSPERYKKWSGYAFPGGHIEEGESVRPLASGSKTNVGGLL